MYQRTKKSSLRTKSYNQTLRGISVYWCLIEKKINNHNHKVQLDHLSLTYKGVITYSLTHRGVIFSILHCYHHLNTGNKHSIRSWHFQMILLNMLSVQCLTDKYLSCLLYPIINNNMELRARSRGDNIKCPCLICNGFRSNSIGEIDRTHNA